MNPRRLWHSISSLKNRRDRFCHHATLYSNRIQQPHPVQVKLHFQDRRDCDVHDPMFVRCLLLGLFGFKSFQNWPLYGTKWIYDLYGMMVDEAIIPLDKDCQIDLSKFLLVKHVAALSIQTEDSFCEKPWVQDCKCAAANWPTTGILGRLPAQTGSCFGLFWYTKSI